MKTSTPPFSLFARDIGTPHWVMKPYQGDVTLAVVQRVAFVAG